MRLDQNDSLLSPLKGFLDLLSCIQNALRPSTSGLCPPLISLFLFFLPLSSASSSCLHLISSHDTVPYTHSIDPYPPLSSPAFTLHSPFFYSYPSILIPSLCIFLPYYPLYSLLVSCITCNLNCHLFTSNILSTGAP